MKRNLPVYGVNTKNLIKYTTTQRDQGRGQNRLPPRHQRRRSQDLYEDPEEANYTITDENEELFDLNGEVDFANTL